MDKKLQEEYKAKEEKKKELEQKALLASLFKGVSNIQQVQLKDGNLRVLADIEIR